MELVLEHPMFDVMMSLVLSDNPAGRIAQLAD